MRQTPTPPRVVDIPKKIKSFLVLFFKKERLPSFFCLLSIAPAQAASKTPVWYSFAANAQHTAPAPAAAKNLTEIRWQTPVDLDPQQNQNDITIHYGSPMLTGADLLLLPLKTTANGNFQLEALTVSTGATLWTLTSDYVLPLANWTPAFPAGLNSKGNVYIAAAGGTVLMRAANTKPNAGATRLAFYGNAVYTAHAKALANTVMVDTPITSDTAGNIYFGFVVEGANPANLKSGIARISASGAGLWVSATAAAADDSITQVAMNCAPAISADGSTLYIAVSNGSAGYLLGLDTTSLATKYKVAAVDPASGQPAWISDISSASPTIGSDGDVYYGVMENPYPNHNGRGWLLHYDETLATVKPPASFGWDDTVALVPASLIPNYKAAGAYLLMTKYNNYLGLGNGDGVNKLAIVDPNATQQDEYSHTPVTVMKEVQTLLGPTKAPKGGVYEWCVNAAVVDAFTGSVFASSEDGHLYRWALATNVLSQKLKLNPPQAEAYTPSLVGPDGTVYDINNATLYAAGK
jgi:hypothetical protein